MNMPCTTMHMAPSSLFHPSATDQSRAGGTSVCARHPLDLSRESRGLNEVFVRTQFKDYLYCDVTVVNDVVQHLLLMLYV